MEKLILASCSPRRSELLTQAGIPFETVNPDVNEECCLPADQAVSVLSARKAKAAGEGNTVFTPRRKADDTHGL